MGLLLAGMSALSYAQEPDLALLAYLTGLGSMSPEMAKETVVYRSMIEAQCPGQVTVDDVKKNEFVNVVNALISSKRMEAQSPGASADTTLLIANNIDCSDLGHPFDVLLSNSDYQHRHPKLVAFLTNLQKASSNFP